MIYLSIDLTVKQHSFLHWINSEAWLAIGSYATKLCLLRLLAGLHQVNPRSLYMQLVNILLNLRSVEIEQPRGSDLANIPKQNKKLHCRMWKKSFIKTFPKNTLCFYLCICSLDASWTNFKPKFLKWRKDNYKYPN